MGRYVTAYAIAAFVFLLTDLVWLSRIAKGFYFGRLEGLLLAKPRVGAAAAFYAVYVIGIVIFAIAPALREGSAMTALLFGALFGFFAYGTYDMTNYATLKNWPLVVSLVDIAWGTCLTAASAVIGYQGARLLFPV